MPVQKIGGVEIVDWPWMQGVNAVANPVLTFAMQHGFSFLARRTPGFKVHTHGLHAGLFDRPTLLVQNHTHKLDWWPIRHTLRRHLEREVSSWIKMRGFNEHPVQRAFLAHTGNIPLSSRGYVIIADHLELFGRRPDEHEYRLLRSHVDDGAPLPSSSWAWKIEHTSRRMLGWNYSAKSTTYAQAVQATYMEMMSASMTLARQSLNAGFSMHIYPEGTISSRLCPGKNGAIQVALAMGLQIVPAGVSGMREAFDGLKMVEGGEVTIRFGEPWRPEPGRYEGFEPFVLESERDFQLQLAQDIQEVMERMNALLEPDYQWMPDLRPDGKSGIYRFVT